MSLRLLLLSGMEPLNGYYYLGLMNVPETFQILLNSVFSDMLDKRLLVYLDDLLVYSEPLALHLIDVHQTL